MINFSKGIGEIKSTDVITALDELIAKMRKLTLSSEQAKAFETMLSNEAKSKDDIVYLERMVLFLKADRSLGKE